MRRTIFLLIVLPMALVPAAATEPWPSRVLITNDNGIDDPKIAALARRFASHVETWVVAPDTDRSGSGSYLPNVLAGTVRIEARALGDGIRAWAVDGFPADCVVVAVAGLMAETPPDLVISGINGGANLGHEWIGSGTIGAARVAALAGIPAIAVSGLDDDIPAAVEAAVDWVFTLAGSDIVRQMDPGDYLTVSLPRTAPGEIRGVKVVNRAALDVIPTFSADSDEPGLWRAAGGRPTERSSPEPSDRTVYEDGFIAVVPMRVDEVDHERLESLSAETLPKWAPPG